jgi:hypothetical protein
MLSKAGFGFEDQLPVNLSARGLPQRPATCEIKNKENEELDLEMIIKLQSLSVSSAAHLVFIIHPAQPSLKTKCREKKIPRESSTVPEDFLFFRCCCRLLLVIFTSQFLMVVRGVDLP